MPLQFQQKKNAATLTNDDGNDMNVVVVKDDSETVTPKNLRDLDITYKDSSGNEKTVKLSSVSDISKSETMDKISRENQKRYLKISAEVKDGYTLTSVSNNVKSAMNDYKLPNSCSIDYAGTDEMTMEAVSQLMLMLLLGIILIYLIMVAQFQSLKSPFIIMFTIPLAFTGGFLALLITGFDISVVSLVGFVMLCGIIVNNGIVLVDYINRLRIDGKERIESIVEAGKTRYASYPHNGTHNRSRSCCYGSRHRHRCRNDAAYRNCLHRRFALRNIYDALHRSRYLRFVQ